MLSSGILHHNVYTTKYHHLYISHIHFTYITQAHAQFSHYCLLSKLVTKMGWEKSPLIRCRDRGKLQVKCPIGKFTTLICKGFYLFLVFCISVRFSWGKKNCNPHVNRSIKWKMALDTF